MPQPTTCPAAPRLQELLNGKLAGDEHAELSQHLETCKLCQQTLDGLVAGGQSWENLARHLGQSQPDAEAVSPAAEEDLGLQFLSPPDKPGQLGRLGHYEVL